MSNQIKKSDNATGGIAAFVPLFVFLALFIGSGVYFSITGTVDRPWGQFPRQAAIFIGIIVACMMFRKIKFNEKFDAFTKSAGESNILMMVSIFLLAGAFAGVAKSMGAATSIVNLGLHLIPSRLMLPGMFLISAVVATAMGSSSGTLVVLAPIALAVAEQVGGNIPMYFAAVWGGCLFGDNLSIISDTTIAATNGAGCEMKDKFRMNFAIALPAAIATMVAYAIIGGGAVGVIEGDLPYSIIEILPYAYVLVSAIAGMNVFVVLTSGIFLAGIIGIVTGKLSFIAFIAAISSGMESMMSMSVIAMMIAGLIGMISLFGGIDWLVTTLRKRIKSRKGAEYCIGVICALLDFSIITNTLTIVVAAPICKDLADEYHIAPKRNASLMDIFACIFLGFIPHGNYLLTLSGFYPDLNPLAVIQNQFYCVFLLIAVVITIQFGLGWTKEEKEFDKQQKLAAKAK